MKRWEQWRKRKKERGGREKKEKGHANKKKGSSASGAMARTSSRGTLHFTRPWDPHQPVSSGFTAMTLWWKPLCCLGCKLRVHTEPWALTLRRSKTLILCVFYSPDSTSDLYNKALEKKKKVDGRLLTRKVWASWGLLRCLAGWSWDKRPFSLR